ncbi:hypothetical protein ACLB2K_010490 [Fragaria x ananassa]
MSFSPAGESPLPSELAPASMFDSGSHLGCKAIFTILIVVLFFFRSPAGSGSETGIGTHGGCKAATGSPSGSASHGITVSEAHIDPQVSTDCTLPATPSASLSSVLGYAICRHCGLTGFLNDEAFEAHLRENEEEEAHPLIVEEEQAVNGEEVVGGDFLVEEAVNEDDEVVEEVEDEDDDELVEEVVNEDDETVEEEVEDEDDDELVEEEAKKKKKKKKDGVVCNFCGRRYETAAALEKHQKKYRMSYYKICGKCKNKLLCKGDYEVHRRGCKG